MHGNAMTNTIDKSHQGNTVVATTKTGIKYVGILSSTTVPGDGNESLGIILSSAQQILNDSSVGPLKKMLVIKSDDLEGFSAKDVGLEVPVSMGNANRAGEYARGVNLAWKAGMIEYVCIFSS
jgi:hypothetical protein